MGPSILLSIRILQASTDGGGVKTGGTAFGRPANAGAAKNMTAESSNARNTTVLQIDTKYFLTKYLKTFGTMILNKLKTVYLLTALTLLLIAAPCYSALQIGDPVPDFTLQQLNGNTITLSSLRGRPTVLFFVCSCTLCRAAGKLWATAISSDPSSLHNARTVVIFTGTSARAKAFLQRTGTSRANWKFYVDPSGNAAVNVFDTDPCPCVYVLSDNQHVVWTTDDAQSRETPELADGLVRHIKYVLANLPQLVNEIPEAASQAPEGQSIHLQTVVGDGSTVSSAQGFPETRFDIGTVDVSVSPTVGHTFILRNPSKAAAVIKGLQASCGCTTAYVDGNPDLPYTIQPGASVQVTVDLDLTDMIAGHFEKSVYVFGENGTDALAYLEIDGRLKAAH